MGLLAIYCPEQTKQWWPSTAKIGTKMLYLPSPARSCGLCLSPACWGAACPWCPLAQLELYLALCARGKLRGSSVENATWKTSWGWAAHSSTSTRGQGSFCQTIWLPSPADLWDPVARWRAIGGSCCVEAIKLGASHCALHPSQQNRS